jgi:hypothetical protein
LQKVREGGEEYILLTGGRLECATRQGELLPAQIISIAIRPGLHPRNPAVEIEYRIEGKEATPLAESSVTPFPLNIAKPRFSLGQTGSVIDPARDIAEGANRNLWCADWIDVTDDRVGFTLVLRDMPLASVGNPGIYRFEPRRVPAESTVYAHLSNTQWGTNFPQWLEGDFSYRVRLVPHNADWRTGYAGGYLYENFYPGGRDYDSLFRLSLSTSTSLLSIRPRHDGRGLIVRAREPLGRHYRARLYVRGPVVKAWRCDLMERPAEQLYIHREPESVGGAWEIDFDMAPHAIETLLIEFDETPEPGSLHTEQAE